jgi:disulfide oxidoreductase YuzD
MLNIIIMGSRKIRHTTGCCGSRNQEEVILGYIPRLYRRFGEDELHCRYVDIADPEATRFRRIVDAVKRREYTLPLAIRDREVVLHGKDTLFKLPDYIEGVLHSHDQSSILSRLFSDNASRRLRKQLRGLGFVDVSPSRSGIIGRVTLGGRTSIFKRF